MDVKKAKVALLKLKHDLDKRGVDFWLREGTLLAAVRDGKFFDWDKDIDLAMRAEDFPRDLPTEMWVVMPRSIFPGEYAEKGFGQISVIMQPAFKGQAYIDIMLQHRCECRKTYVTLAPPFGG